MWLRLRLTAACSRQLLKPLSPEHLRDVEVEEVAVKHGLQHAGSDRDRVDVAIPEEANWS